MLHGFDRANHERKQENKADKVKKRCKRKRPGWVQYTRSRVRITAVNVFVGNYIREAAKDCRRQGIVAGQKSAWLREANDAWRGLSLVEKAGYKRLARQKQALAKFVNESHKDDESNHHATPWNLGDAEWPIAENYLKEAQGAF